jgi:hypothetical protein
VEQGRAVRPTLEVDPFFVPINIKPRNSGLPAVKFAFLDGRGEAYQPVEDENTDLFKVLGDDIVNLFQSFSYGLTVIFVAPYSIGSGHGRDTTAANFGLLGALRGYRDFRKMRSNDFLLYLLSKWDQYASPVDSNGLFDRVGPADVDRVLRERYGLSWGDFQSLPLEGPARARRAFLQYSSGYFVDGHPRHPPAKFTESFNRYPRILLNWLYGNATQFRITGNGTSTTLRKVLFNDVEPSSSLRLTLSERLLWLLTSR